eukprot:TRINITY_DN1050_c0_g1_i2.p2 TRINITY_DN1050_c0_g1~~TRINITY_DN1050_c0_g1_i2.p2  ORF type:complete len:618 (+),score=90.29 TRINITY_DN1050_c0_g1_i2:312-2165(+)
MQTTQVLEKYRRLFLSLSNPHLTLSESDILAAQQAASNSEAWRAHFLSRSCANLRCALSYALLDSVSIRISDDVRYERDEGMMEGDDGGYTTPDSLLEDDRGGTASIPCYNLLGTPAITSPNASVSTSRQSTATVLLAEQALHQLIDRQQYQPSEKETQLVSELQQFVRKAQMGKICHPDQLSDALKSLVERHNPPATAHKLLEASISAARECARVNRERDATRSNANALLTGLLSANAKESVLTSKTVSCRPRKRPRAPTFPNAWSRPTPPASLLEILGGQNPIAKNVFALRRLHVWRATVVAKIMESKGDPLAKKGVAQFSPRVKSPRLRGKKARKDVIEIFNDVESTAVSTTQDRLRATLLSACALLLSHANFSHASTNSLNFLADVVEEFIMQIGASLSAMRENIDKGIDSNSLAEGYRRRKTADERAEELRIICESGPKGGFLDLLYYTKLDANRTAGRIHEAEKRLELQVLNDKAGAALFQDPEQTKLIDAIVRAELNNLPRPPESKGSVKSQDTPISEDDLKLDDEQFNFGYLCESVRLDVLGDVTVPVRAVYGKRGTLSTAANRVERFQRSPRPKSKNISMQSSSASSTLGSSFTPVKTEVKFVDIGDG